MIRRVIESFLAALLIILAFPKFASGETLIPSNPAAENPVLISEIYPDAPDSVSEKDPEQGEFIEIYNQSSSSVLLTGFSIDITTTASGATYTIDLSAIDLAAYEHLGIRDLDSVTNFSLANDGATVELKYTVGGLVLTLSSITYTSLASDFSWSFIGQDWLVGLPTPGAPNQAQSVEEKPLEAECDLIDVVINEILANPSGADSNGEFVELNNRGTETVSLAGCKIRTDKIPEIVLGDIELPAGGYHAVALSDDLLNAGGSVWFITKTTEEIVEYSALDDNEAWALISGTWQLTTLSTPGSANLPTLEEQEPEEEGLAPCPAGKFRNPETNRCKNIVDAASSLLPCGPGEQRNPATNRCRKITILSALTACRPGQERNPETNRCRKVNASSGLSPCQSGYERNSETNRCRKSTSGVAGVASFSNTSPSELHNGLLVSVALLALAYGAWEYRLDIANWLSKIKAKK